MNNSSIITVKNISKKYNINHQRGGYIALRDVITNIFKNPFTFLKSKTKEVLGIETKEEFWALKDVNFEIMKGEVVGIIGRNGAGKSTLLKILSQITPPTTGEIRINGTVGSLLEVGTGFHPELTGRENIFLNGAILGMKKKDIVRKFDEIVKFADIEKFLDTPVKYYSSGMYVRLAFSVAAHMETDILIIDEVLAVGDAEFQKKCLGKMNEITKEEGRTILFVSHDMEAVKKLCSKVLLLKNGRVNFFDKTYKTIEHYLNNLESSTSVFEKDRKDREGLGNVKIKDFRILTTNGIKTGEDISFVANYENYEDVKITEFGVSIWDINNYKLISISSQFKNQLKNIPQNGEIQCTIVKLPLVRGDYFINFFISSNHGIEDYITHIKRISIEESNYYNGEKVVNPDWGKIIVAHNWKIN
ncbi:TPA: ABC transporter ATP-binding protein [Candidatus Nomurabacteria bacterium]|uniref:ABC transporter related protein n=1 Tax=Candidatus Nomurabacteria bacterium GW2011_GWE1_35_16 TaxID=1618761 RepID=A0A0G0EFJ6_9BACT|nr:MAG: ABC transporter related protein [Candidatus Nomurabacteria bacterium GW2011_GWF1_34_20]KKP62740.1 MAG: ABC transporter related protein [Candidatus Nomurabacteria bacterium GW2011_GWE2_34_25]KKP66112.1 MAG: ABC transporter related protein [Candidatus Nomurabacteria bacterium GW2011_GWE1_35_16]HAE36348.1 ABC transporter ATP-binding protein [Candidatus Nomurabacteria bacterium]HAX65378.1 ABC transporter ATP-binding protein [Candidatus Nomurabacteria bacterium]